MGAVRAAPFSFGTTVLGWAGLRVGGIYVLRGTVWFGRLRRGRPRFGAVRSGVAKEVKVQEPVNQENLPEAIRDGRISQEEVDHIWRETEYLSPQTPVEIRRTIVALKEAGHEVTPIQQILLQTVMDLRAGLFRSESKFAHLVAGTETIVDKLQAINKWEMLVENLSAKLDQLTMTVNKLIDATSPSDAVGSDEPDPDDPYGPGAKPIKFDDDPYVAEPEPEEEYDRKIGSNWDAKNPRKR